MTIHEILSQCDELTPNGYSDQQKMMWLAAIEEQIYREIVMTHEDSESVTYSPITGDSDPDTALIVPSAYSDVYRFYLEGQISLSNNERGRYENAMTAFREALGNFHNYYNRHHMALPVARVIKVM